MINEGALRAGLGSVVIIVERAAYLQVKKKHRQHEKIGTLTSFSEQEVVDCTLHGKDTCNRGGEMHDGITEIAKNHGGKINTEKQYPYTGKSLKKCKADDSDAVDAGITGYGSVSSGDEDGVYFSMLFTRVFTWNLFRILPFYCSIAALKAATYAKTVISVGIDASSFDFQVFLKLLILHSWFSSTPRAASYVCCY